MGRTPGPLTLASIRTLQYGAQHTCLAPMLQMLKEGPGKGRVVAGRPLRHASQVSQQINNDRCLTEREKS